MKNAMKNSELLESYNKNPKRGSVASEMCRRAGTIKYLLEYCTDDDKTFYSCMRDTISVLSGYPERRY